MRVTPSAEFESTMQRHPPPQTREQLADFVKLTRSVLSAPTEQERLTVKAPGATGEARRLLMDWKVAAGTPAMVFTITFPLTVPVGRGL